MYKILERPDLGAEKQEELLISIWTLVWRFDQKTVVITNFEIWSRAGV